MALRALLLGKNISKKEKELEELRAKAADFEKRETVLAQAIDEAAAAAETAETDEEKQAAEEAQATVEKEVDDFETEKEDVTRSIEAIEEELTAMRAELDKIEEEDVVPPVTREKEDNKMDEIRTALEKEDIYQREDVKAYLSEIRTCIKEKRALTNVGLTIPQVFLGLLRENIMNYSKLYKHVNVRPVSGQARQVIMGTYPEAIWTECCAALNELSLGFNNVDVDCFKVSGYFAVCNSTIEDSDLDLSAELLTAIGQAIGIALDKAILYGRNASTTLRMPMGIVSRLVQEEEPADYPATARTWADLHTSNVISIAASVKGVDLFKRILVASGAIKGKYARGEKVWVMNETTYTKLKAEAMSINAAGAIVSGLEGTMPVVGGVVEVLDFLADDVIIGGYFELYLLAERAGAKFATSEHVQFIQDNTVLKGTARYDGVPVIAEAFAAIGINGATPTSAMTFAS